ncbi:MAG TPA: AsmA family protein [Stellaceae bacterium]|nr:AsmA family protein [Stellaceae bacterium]
MNLVKRLLIGIAVVVVLLIAAVIAVPFLIPVDTYKSKLVAAVKDSTGRDLRIDGKMSFSLFPVVGLEANDVSFSNPPGAASKDMAKLGKLQVALQVLPLLHRDIEIKRLVLVDPVIDLEVDKQGRPNWQFSASPAPATPAKQPDKAAPGGGGGSLSDLHLDDVRLVNGRVTYLDQRSGAKQELSEIGMTVSLPSLDGPFSAAGAATWRNEKMTLAASLAKPRAFMDGKTSAAALKLASKPINFDFKGEGAGSTPLKLDGAVDLQVPSVRGLAAWAGQPLKLPGTGLGPLAISGKVSMAGSKIAFSDASLGLDDMKAKGELALDSGGARPALKGKLDVDKLDANPYLPPEKEAKPAPAAGKPGGGPAAAKSDWSDDPIDLTPLKSADVDFALTAGGLQYRKIQVGKSALALKLVNGRFESDLTELALYKGAGKGKVVLDGSGAVPAIEADFNLSGVQVQPLLHDAADLDRVSGTGGFATAVSGHGKSQREIITALNGKGDLNFANGVIKGLNLVGMVKNVAASFQGAQSGADQTDFSNLTGTYTITNGILRNSDLQLKSAEVPMTGAGTVDLPHRSVDYKITPKIAGAIAVPVVIKGPWDNLSYQPDLAGMVGDPSKLLRKGGKGLGDALKGQPKVDDVLKGLLGGQKKQ